MEQQKKNHMELYYNMLSTYGNKPATSTPQQKGPAPCYGCPGWAQWSKKKLPVGEHTVAQK